MTQSDPTRSVPTAPPWAPPPRIGDLGPWGWVRARLRDRPIRADRSRALHDEPGGRLDRLDVWVIVVLIASILTLRMWRLEQPYTMHFDEVYHARTATEFLQDWRYGISHDIYEWTHPHLAKYAMALGLVAFGDDRVASRSSLGVSVTAAAVEPRWDDRDTATARQGDRLFVATGSEIRAYDMATEALVARVPLPGAAAIDVDTSGHRVVVGTTSGAILTIDTTLLDDARLTGAAPDVTAVDFAHLDGPVRAIHVTNDGSAIVVGLDQDRIVTVDGLTAEELGRQTVPGYGQMTDAGSTGVVVASIAGVSDPAAEASFLGPILNVPRASLAAKLGSQGQTVLGVAPTGVLRTQLDTAISSGELAGISVRQQPRVAVAARGGLVLLATATGSTIETVSVSGAASGVALVTGIDADKLYVSVATTSGPTISIVTLAPDGRPTMTGAIKMPGGASWVAYDRATQMVHALGTRPTANAPLAGTSGAPLAGTTGAGTETTPTIYVIEPHGNAVYADAPLDFTPAAVVMDADPRYPTTDRQQILALAPDGTDGSVDIGSHEFAWRLPGVIAGALEAALLYVLARLLFRRRSIAVIAGLLTLLDGMMFVQSRIGMNDAYVALFIVAAYALFTAVWLRARRGWRSWAAFWLSMPMIGLLLGLGLASKWVAAYAIAALGILILARSALGRLVLILGLIAGTTVLGTIAITVPGGSNGANNLFLVIMIGLTLAAVIANVLHPIAWSWEELRFAVGAPLVAGAGLALLAVAAGRFDARVTFGALAATPAEAAFALILLSGAIYAVVLAGRRLGFGPLAAAPTTPEDPVLLLPPPAPAPPGWLRIGAGFGLPALWMLICLVGVPLAVYVASYIPWAYVEGHQIVPGWPPGHTGQTLAQLTLQMYQYHNGLVAAHPAQSPWWAWPFDLKPVWFYQGSFAGGTAAAIYDAGNLVIWWLGIPAMGFVAWQAFKRRSLPLALLAIGFAWQWLAWSRIDRAAFQYHYYTSLPFLILALAYFLAELWHGASRRTWLLARMSAAAAIVAPMTMWLLHRPLCAFVRVDAVNPGSQACPTLIPSFVLTGRTLAIAIVVGIGVLLLVRQFLSLAPPDAKATDRDGHGAALDGGSGSGGSRSGSRSLLWLVVTAAATMVALAIATTVFSETPILDQTGIPVEPIAIVLLLPLVGIAAFVAAARDAQRFVAGYLVAVAAWFVVWYPNLSALPLPAAVVNAYQGLLPTYVYPFQFPVSKIDRNSITTPLLAPGPALLLASLAVTCLVVGYTAWVWRVTAAQRRAEADGGRPASETVAD
ncbi:MAG TPA: phospholipid carrier-dependent glycosyltransferase [Candidatus Limnocylindrales bacterium]